MVATIKDKKEIRRCIPIKKLTGVTINKKNNEEVVLHITNEPDIRFLVKHRTMMLDVLKVAFLNNLKVKNTNLPIYGVSYSSLSMYEKTQQDLKKGIESKEPDELNRLEDEDLIKMNLDEAVLQEDEDEDSVNMEIVFEETKTNVIDIDDISRDISEY